MFAFIISVEVRVFSAAHKCPTPPGVLLYANSGTSDDFNRANNIFLEIVRCRIKILYRYSECIYVHIIITTYCQAPPNVVAATLNFI